MLQSFRHADFEELARLWGSFYPERYRIDPDLLRLNTVECPTFDWGASLIDMPDGKARGFVVIKKASAGSLYPGKKVDCAYIGALVFKEPQIGVDLLAQVKHVLYNRGVQFLNFGQDAWHFFPGCPTDCKKLMNMLMVEGFSEGREFCDLEADLNEYQNKYPAPAGAQIRPLESGDVKALKEFLNTEFAGRWCYDVEEKIAREKNPASVLGIFQGDEMEGFVRLQSFNDKFKMAGACWHLALGEKWGSLGPIGIAEGKRGQGYGHALLAASIERLRAMGVERCIIDWTDKNAFYEKHGFEVTRRYREMTLNLESLPTQHTMTDVGLL
jgi:predicted N-acetyltransferase YhbS